MHVTCSRSFVLLCRRCNKLCTSSLVDDAIFAHIGLYGTGEAAVECSSVTHQGQALISHSSVCSRWLTRGQHRTVDEFAVYDCLVFLAPRRLSVHSAEIGVTVVNGITKKVCNISKIAMVLSFCFQYTLTWVSIQIYPQLSRYFHKVYMFHFTLLCPVFFVHILCISENFYKQMHVIHVLFDLVCWCAKPVDVLSILSLQWRICL